MGLPWQLPYWSRTSRMARGLPWCASREIALLASLAWRWRLQLGESSSLSLSHTHITHLTHITCLVHCLCTYMYNQMALKDVVKALDIHSVMTFSIVRVSLCTMMYGKTVQIKYGSECMDILILVWE